MYTRMRCRFGMVAGAVTLGFVGTLGVGPSAVAETVNMASQPGVFYVYEHDDFKGGSAAFTSSDSDLRNNSWYGQPGRIIDNNISSMKNQTDREIYLYDAVGCTGEYYLARKKSEDGDLTKNTNNPSFDNRTSCIKFS